MLLLRSTIRCVGASRLFSERSVSVDCQGQSCHNHDKDGFCLTCNSPIQGSREVSCLFPTQFKIHVFQNFSLLCAENFWVAYNSGWWRSGRNTSSDLLQTFWQGFFSKSIFFRNQIIQVYFSHKTFPRIFRLPFNFCPCCVFPHPPTHNLWSCLAVAPSHSKRGIFFKELAPKAVK